MRLPRCFAAMKAGGDNVDQSSEITTTRARAESVELLLAAYRTGEPIDPLTDRFPGLTVDDAYAIQVGQVQRWQADGALIKGHKVGLSSAAMQRQLGVGQPDFGHLTDAMFFLESEPIDSSRFLAPKVEPEIAFVLGKPLAGLGSRSPRRWRRWRL